VGKIVTDVCVKSNYDWLHIKKASVVTTTRTTFIVLRQWQIQQWADQVAATALTKT